MATHDYVIANGTGAAVRSDLNDALAAIVSNNSSSSEPATTYAYQWWADTTNNQLRLRNSANNAWITIFELDGTMLMEQGSAASPGLAFVGDLNTGIFRPAADAVGLTTGGAERFAVGGTEAVFNDPSNDVDFRVESNGQTHMLFVDAGNDRVGIGASVPKEVIDARGAAVFSGEHSTAQNAYGTAHGIMLSSTSNLASIKSVSNGSNNVAIRFVTLNSGSGIEAMRLDPSGNVGIGSNAPLARLEVSDDAQSDVTAGDLIVDTTGLSADVIVGRLSGRSNDNTTFRVRDRVDNSLLGSSTSVPFSVGAGGTERIRLDSSGRLLLGTSTGQSVSGHTPNLQVSGTDFSSATVSITNNANSANGSYLFFCKQRSGSPGGSTVLQANDLIGQLRWVGGDGNDMDSLAAILQVKVDGPPGSNDMPGRMEFATTGDGGSSPTIRMTIDNAGRVGIGASSAAQVLQVHKPSSASSHVHITNTVSGSASSDGMLLGLTATLAEALVWNQENTDMRFATNNTERCRINTTGDFLVGTTSHSPGLGNTNNGCQISAASHIAVSRSSGQPAYFNRNTTTGTIVSLHYNGTERGRISTDGTVVAYNTSSDYRLKENIVDLDGAITRVKQLQPRRFNFIEVPSKTVDGFVAHEAATVVPEAVTGTHNEVDSDNNPVYQGIDQSKLVPLLTAALQEAIAKIETLETKVAALEAG